MFNTSGRTALVGGYMGGYLNEGRIKNFTKWRGIFLAKYI
jgi:hypothetical protein